MIVLNTTDILTELLNYSAGNRKNFGDAKISSASTADGRTHANSTAVSFEVSDYMTAYIAPTITLNENSSLYFKINTV